MAADLAVMTLLDGLGDIFEGATAAKKGISVIGPRDTYREFAKKIGEKFLDIVQDDYSWIKNLTFLEGVVERGDDVVFAGKFIPKLLDPTSYLAKEINYLKAHGYEWVSDFSKMVRK